MCRITGFWDLNYRGNYSLEDVTTNMRDTLVHGGPDDAGTYIDREHDLALSHRRLSILDLSSLGHQPMSNADESLWIIYNGEVYNFGEIREDLKKIGHSFISRTDTEVILKAYEEWGIDAVHKFRGMFVFCIWDKSKEKLILCRDRVGVKPLYFYSRDGLFMFTSELKAFHKHPKFHKELNEEALALYLQFGYITAPHSIFKSTYKLMPGHYIEIDKKGNINERKYWDAQEYYQDGLRLQQEGHYERKSEQEIEEELESILVDSFKLRLVSDVPVGIFLSGGFDSSIVTALVQRHTNKTIKTFTMGFKERSHNEAEWAKKVANHIGTEHTEIYCTQQDAINVLPWLADVYDEPLGDSSTIPTYLLSHFAKQDVKVCMSADGGDEFFCGYPKYWTINNKLNRLANFPFLGRAANLVSPEVFATLYKVFRPILPKLQNPKDKYKKIQGILNAKNAVERSVLASSSFLDSELCKFNLRTPEKNFDMGGSCDPISNMMLYDSKTHLPDDIMVKVDRASMAVALEAREPMLDHRILEYVTRLPMHYKYRNGESKYILRKILYRYVPKELVCRPKQGFGLPVYEWFQSQLKDYYFEYLNKDKIKKEGLLNSAAIDSLLGKGEIMNHNKLWLLLNFQMWKEKWL